MAAEKAPVSVRAIGSTMPFGLPHATEDTGIWFGSIGLDGIRYRLLFSFSCSPLATR
jgi:hypothetical protein